MHGHAHHPLPAWASPRHILEAYLGTPGSLVLLLRKVVFGAFHMHGVVWRGPRASGPRRVARALGMLG